MSIQSLSEQALSDLALTHPEAAAELVHLRAHVDRLQGRGTELVLENRALRAAATSPAVTLRWKKMSDFAPPRPARVWPEEAGHDLAVIVERDMRGVHFGGPHELANGATPWISVYHGALVTFCIGWAVEIPLGYVGVIKVRSSVGQARWVLASSGVIDPTYRGEIKVPLLYLGTDPYTVKHGQRMAQMLVVPRPTVEDIEVEELSPSKRGTGGFGSTGK